MNHWATFSGEPPNDIPELVTRHVELAGDGQMRFTHEPDDVRHDNNRRAFHASVAVIAYAEASGDTEEPVETVISDLLTDLAHLADALGVEFADLLERSQSDYHPEVRGEL